jgi:hypothetical protein
MPATSSYARLTLSDRPASGQEQKPVGAWRNGHSTCFGSRWGLCGVGSGSLSTRRRAAKAPIIVRFVSTDRTSVRRSGGCGASCKAVQLRRPCQWPREYLSHGHGQTMCQTRRPRVALTSSAVTSIRSYRYTSDRASCSSSRCLCDGKHWKSSFDPRFNAVSQAKAGSNRFRVATKVVQRSSIERERGPRTNPRARGTPCRPLDNRDLADVSDVNRNEGFAHGDRYATPQAPAQRRRVASTRGCRSSAAGLPVLR